MECPRCACANPPGAGFCGACGSVLAALCRHCGHPNVVGNRFCNACGTGLPPADAPAAAPGPGFLTSTTAQEGERKHVTVVFADLRDSLALIARRDPEDARQVLDAVLQRLMDAVHRYDGTVNQVMGDGVMALFGAPVAQEDHAVRACRAALDMQRAIGEYAREVGTRLGPSPPSGSALIRARWWSGRSAAT